MSNNNPPEDLKVGSKGASNGGGPASAPSTTTPTTNEGNGEERMYRNGSIIKMTMQNNHLIVETEERNVRLHPTTKFFGFLKEYFFYFFLGYFKRRKRNKTSLFL